MVRYDKVMEPAETERRVMAKRTARRRWTDAEIEIAQDTNLTSAQVAKKVKRTVGAVASWRSVNGVHTFPNSAGTSTSITDAVGHTGNSVAAREAVENMINELDEAIRDKQNEISDLEYRQIDLRGVLEIL